MADRREKRLTFAANGSLWALRFATPEAYAAFLVDLEDKVGCWLAGALGCVMECGPAHCWALKGVVERLLSWLRCALPSA